MSTAWSVSYHPIELVVIDLSAAILIKVVEEAPSVLRRYDNAQRRHALDELGA